MTKVILVRHGQSMGNLERRFLGHTDLPLTSFGVAQAERVAEHLKEEKIDAIYSSDLLRAYQTAEPTARMHGLSIKTDEALREIFAGEWEGDTFVHIDALWHEAFSTFRSDIGHAVLPGGEATMDVGKRVYDCVTAICAEHPDKTVMIATHATAIGMFTVTALGLDADHARHISLPSNASTSVFEYRDGCYFLRQYSEDDYLQDLKLHAPPTA